LILSEMTWPELAKVKDEIEIVLIPVGSCEQHGPSMTFGTDAIRAYEYSKLIAQRLGNRALVSPPVNYGISPHHMCFPGTVTLRPETMIALLCDICISLHKHGFKSFAFLSGHGGNNPLLNVTVTKLKAEYGIESFFTPIGLYEDAIDPAWGWSAPRLRGHACEAEASQALAICPWIVRDERVPGDLAEDCIFFREDNPFRCGGTWSYSWDEWTHNGGLGDNRKASAEAGWICTERSMERVLEMIEFFVRRNAQ